VLAEQIDISWRKELSAVGGEHLRHGADGHGYNVDSAPGFADDAGFEPNKQHRSSHGVPRRLWGTVGAESG
jgi:hypothetical protein